MRARLWARSSSVQPSERGLRRSRRRPDRKSTKARAGPAWWIGSCFIGAFFSLERDDQRVVPVAALDRRAEGLERDADIPGDRLVAGGVAIAGGIGVGSALEEPVGRAFQREKTRFDRADRAGSHAAAGGGVDRVLAQALDRRAAQGVDRRLGEHQAAPAQRLAEVKDEQGLAAASQGALVGRAADVDVDDEACGIAMWEPGGTVRAVADDVRKRRSGQDLFRQSPAREVAPSV